jgi:hypothetical protein
MNQADAAVAAAAIAAATALVGVVVTSAVALHNEARRRQAAVTDSNRLALRSRAADVFVHLFHLQHEMEWLTWHAVNRPAAIDRDFMARYEAAVHATYPKILGAMAVLASLDLGLYHSLVPIVDHVYDLEGDLAGQIGGLSQSTHRPGSIAELANRHATVVALYQSLPPKLAESMHEADRKYQDA